MKNKKKTRRNPTIKQLRIGQKVWVNVRKKWQKLPIIDLRDPNYYSRLRPVIIKANEHYTPSLLLKDIFLEPPEPEEIKWRPNIKCGVDTRKINCLLSYLIEGYTLLYLGKSRTKKNLCQDSYETDVGSYVRWLKGSKGEGHFLLVPVEGRYCISEKELKRRLFSKDDSGKWYIVYKEL